MYIFRLSPLIPQIFYSHKLLYSTFLFAPVCAIKQEVIFFGSHIVFSPSRLSWLFSTLLPTDLVNTCQSNPVFLGASSSLNMSLVTAQSIAIYLIWKQIIFNNALIIPVFIRFFIFFVQQQQEVDFTFTLNVTLSIFSHYQMVYCLFTLSIIEILLLFSFKSDNYKLLCCVNDIEIFIWAKWSTSFKCIFNIFIIWKLRWTIVMVLCPSSVVY